MIKQNQRQLPVSEYHSRLYKLDELILDVYNAVYAKSDNYKVKFIDSSDLKLERFKMFDYDLDQIFSKTPIKYINMANTGIDNVQQIILKRQGETHMSNIRIVPYSSKEEMIILTSPINVNLIIRTLLSELDVTERTNNILLPIINIDVSGEDLKDYEVLSKLVDPKKFYSVQVTEKYYSMTTLDKFISSNPLVLSTFKSIIYQAVDILYQISNVYPGFKCNLFFPEYIDCYLKYDERNILMPVLKLGNFFLGEIKEVIDNDLLKKVDIPTVDIPYSDLYQLLNWFWSKHSIDIKKIPEMIKLFDYILPAEIRTGEQYLTHEMWNKITDDQRADLKIKIIRNNNFFTSKDSAKNPTYVDQEEFGLIKPIASTEQDLNSESESPVEIELDTDNDDDYANERVEPNLESNPDSYPEERIEIIKKKSDNTDTSSTKNHKLKKSLNNHIDNMSNIKNIDDEDTVTLSDTDTEPNDSSLSRIIKINSEHRTHHNAPKKNNIYKGERELKNGPAPEQSRVNSGKLNNEQIAKLLKMINGDSEDKNYEQPNAPYNNNGKMAGFFNAQARPNPREQEIKQMVGQQNAPQIDPNNLYMQPRQPNEYQSNEYQQQLMAPQQMPPQQMLPQQMPPQQYPQMQYSQMPQQYQNQMPQPYPQMPQSDIVQQGQQGGYSGYGGYNRTANNQPFFFQ